jgi:hypothetical protein
MMALLIIILKDISVTTACASLQNQGRQARTMKNDNLPYPPFRKGRLEET